MKTYSIIAFFAKILLSGSLLIGFNYSYGQSNENYLSFSSVEEMYNYFAPDFHRFIPLIQGHRGTKECGFPEGTIPCFEYLLEHTRASIEIDPRLTKDSVMVVFHDATLNRASNGKGKIRDFTWEQLQQFNLKNSRGEVTPHKIPLLEDIIEWAEGKTVLVLDHKDVPPSMIANLIKKKNASRYIINTVWSLDEALVYFKEDSSRMFLISIRSKESIQDYLEAGIPPNQLIGSLGTEWNESAKKHCEELKSFGISSLLATASTYDKIQNENIRINTFLTLKNNCVNIIESDYPVEISRILHQSDK